MILLMIYKKLHNILLAEGFSIGISDMIADNKTNEKIRNIIQDQIKLKLMKLCKKFI